MIFHVTHPLHAYTHATILLYYRPDLLPIFRHIPYEHAEKLCDVASGVVIWSDIDRLSEEERNAAVDIYDVLAQTRPTILQLNHPRRSLRRHELLDALHACGINTFRAFHATMISLDLRFPVFVRDDAGACNVAPRLLHDFDELERELDRPEVTAMVRPLVVEYGGQAHEDGYFRKFGAYRVGDQIYPQHCFAGRDWFIKNPTRRMLQAHIEETRAYFRDNPDAGQLMPIFELADIQFGRIDYMKRDGRIEVFEINTNPNVLAYPPTPLDASDERPYADRHAEALRALPQALDANSTSEIERIHQSILSTLRTKYRLRWAKRLLRNAMRRALDVGRQNPDN